MAHWPPHAVDSPLTFVIVSWNARTHLDRCLRAAVPLGYAVVVVDNDSRDGSAAMVARAYPSAQLLASPTNLGFAGGVNAGVRASRTPWVVVLNPDVVVEASAIARFVAAAEAEPTIGAAGARLVDEHGAPQAGFAVRRFPTLATLAVDLLLIDKLWPSNPVTARYHATDLSLASSQDVEQPAAACLLIRRTAFDAVGGFDAAFHPAWFEDVDFCRRLRAAGWRVRYVADASLRHEGGVAMRSLGLSSYTSIWYRNMTRYVDRHFSGLGRLAYRALLVVGMGLRALASLLRGRPGDAAVYLRVVPQAFRYP